MKFYILDADNNVVEASILDAAIFKEKHFDRCIVGKYEDGLVEVSTVFCGMQIQLDKGLFFETKVWGKNTELTQRYASWAEAEEGHNAIVWELKSRN